MRLSAVLDSTVLVSAFLTSSGAADALVDYAKTGRFACPLSEDILAETARVLLETPRIRQRYPYADADVHDYLQGLRQAALLASDLPYLSGPYATPTMT
jgi:predicted nucleic acid-binding protein